MDIVAEPKVLSFGQVSPGDVVKRSLRLTPDGPHIAISAVKSLDERITLERTSDEEHAYDVILAGEGDLGAISSRIRVEYTGGDSDHVDVALWGSVVGDLSYPRQLSLRFREGAYQAQTLRIKSRSGQTVQIRSATDPAGKVTARLTKPTATTAEVEVSVVDGVEGPARGTLEVRTNDRLEPTVKVGYYVVPKPGAKRARTRPTGSARRLEK